MKVSRKSLLDWETPICFFSQNIEKLLVQTVVLPKNYSVAMPDFAVSKHVNAENRTTVTYYRGYSNGTAAGKMTGQVPTPARCIPSRVFLLPSCQCSEGLPTLPGLPKLLLVLWRPGSLVPGSLSRLLLWLVRLCSVQHSFGCTLATRCSTSWKANQYIIL